MVIGPTGGGKTQVFNVLRQALAKVRNIQIREARLNSKAITASQMYGEIDLMSDEWTTGVFAAIWTKYNNRSNPYSTWIVCDAPVDTFWIEDLNTVLDDNQILTLANGDRIPMTDNVKIMFENETLINASPATVSRCGIIYVSQSNLGWTPIAQAWAKRNPKKDNELLKQKAILLKNFYKYMGDNETPDDAGKLFDFIARKVKPVMPVVIAGSLRACTRMIDGLMAHIEVPRGEQGKVTLEKIFLYALTWSIGALLEDTDREKWGEYLREQAGDQADAVLPNLAMPGDTIYDYFIEDTSPNNWVRWSAPKWEYPKVPAGGKLRFSSLLVPTMDSRRSLYVMSQIQSQGMPVMMTGSQGTAKTSTALMWAETFDAGVMGFKFVNFSSATLQINFQQSVEESLDKRGGNSFGPPNGKKLTVFIDDISMPEINEWGDQPTNEIVRQLVEFGNFAFLDKDKRGVMKKCDDLVFLAAMTHPGGGRNDVPNRLKSHFLIFNIEPPSIESINDIYGQILEGYFRKNKSEDFLAAGGVNLNDDGYKVVEKFTQMTIDVWNKVRRSLLPTPAKFHYVFTMRELSRVFQGVLSAPMETVNTGGIVLSDEKLGAPTILVRLLRHECERVFCDKLTNNKDKNKYLDIFGETAMNHFGEWCWEEGTGNVTDNYFVDFFREDVYDEDDNLVEAAPKIYECGGDMENIRSRALMYMARYNTQYPSSQLNLVLFDDALGHLMRITRIIQMPRGSALLVGVGGSGKQSLTKLAAFIARHRLFQIKLTKTYNETNFGDDLKECFVHAGTVGPVTFLFTDAQIKKENFLEFINATLLTGDVPGLFTKEEMMAATADVSPLFAKTYPGEDATPVRLRQFFIDIVRDRLHMVLCMSPANAKFPKRARKFPGIISGCTINWFLSWPQDALVAVSRGFIGDFEVECTDSEKEQLMIHMGEVHNMATQACEDYFQSMRRNVYQTPKSFLSFLADFKIMYGTKLQALKKKAANIALGLDKLQQGAKDVAAMKIVLKDQQVKLGIATEETNKMLASLEISSAEALKEAKLVGGIKESCDDDRERIAGEKSVCLAELAKAQPYVDDANKAIDSIKPGDIGEVKVLKKPSDIIRLTFDCVLLLYHRPLDPVVPLTLIIKKQEVPFLTPSWGHALPMMASSDFLKKLQWFGNGYGEGTVAGKDLMNAETIELLSPYINLENFNPATAKSASQAAEGLCKFVTAMKFYYEASKLIKPKLEALAVAEGQLAHAEAKLAEASKRLDACNARLADLTATFENQMAEKTRIEDGARALERKMDMASQLINGLSGERVRWAEDSKLFGDEMKRLIGDCAVSCAFVSYCGAFNQEFRLMMINELFRNDCERREIPVSSSIEVTEFLVEATVVGEWNLQGLPTDLLSTQNGILVTRSSRFPLMIDPQAQAINWIRNKEMDRLPPWKETNVSNSKLKDQLEFCMSEGKAMIVVGIEEEIDPLLDPVMQKEIVKKGRSYYITVADQMMDYDPSFMCYFVTRLPKPHFSPELQAMTTVVDFAVTRLGLEDQLLGIVIGQEQRALQDQLQEVLAECNANRRTLDMLDAELLERLSSGEGNLLDDTELVGVLNETKTKANDVKAALIKAVETRESINEKREQFRPVATRGSVLYFSIVETSQVNVMYQTSLQQFLSLFLSSMRESEPARIVSKRVVNISEFMTYLVYRYINRGLYEEHKLTFVFIVTLKVLVVAASILQSDVTLLLQGGAALNITNVRKKPYEWISDEAWLNVIEVSTQCQFYRDLPDSMTRNEAGWRAFYECNIPERAEVPDYATAIDGDARLGPWYRLLIVRTLRVDRSMLAIKDFIKATPQIGARYVEPVTDLLESIYDEMVNHIPTIFLLSAGADPTDSILQLCRKRKCSMVATISMGEGQERPAMAAIVKAAEHGGWVLLQNCELGLELMEKMEDILVAYDEGPTDNFSKDFRLFITAAPDKNFPLGLLQLGTKVTNEPPSGLRAGLMRSYATTIDQDRMERVDGPMWKRLLFVMCFLHSVVQERRKFGPLGWSIPYEYNLGDIEASLLFLEKHLYAGPPSWSTVQYMVSEIQYGGKITDDLDRRLFNTFAALWLCPTAVSGGFDFNPTRSIEAIPDGFTYDVPLFQEHKGYSDFVSHFPEIDSPELSGLHPNADLTFRVKEAASMMDALLNTQPRSSGGGGGAVAASPEEVVHKRAGEMLQITPEAYSEDSVKAQMRSIGGMDNPLNIFLFQEIRVLSVVVDKVQYELSQLQLAIDGEVVMTDEYAKIIGELFSAKVPVTWMFTATGIEYSWINSTIGLWMGNFGERNAQIRSWLDTGRPSHFSLAGFFNPQGFLTSMKQEVTRRHKGEGWALDDMVYHTEVTDFATADSVRSGAKEGVYCSGLFLDGCAWSRLDGSLVESEPKKLFTLLPVLWVTATTKSIRKDKIKTGMYGPRGPYECPLYKYPARTDRFYVCIVNLASKAVDHGQDAPLSNHWILRGVALTATTDYLSSGF
jgi:dynein heavy chain, axonemal